MTKEEAKKKELKYESIKMTKVSNFIRGIICLSAFSILMVFKDSLPSNSVNYGFIGVSVLFVYSLLLSFFLYNKKFNITESKLFVFFQYISSAIDVIMVSLILWNIGEYRTFKSVLYLSYFLFVGIAAFQYSTYLTTFTAFLSMSLYLGMFFLAASQGYILIGTSEQEYTSIYVSQYGVIVRSALLLLMSIVLNFTSKGYSNIIKRVVENQLALQKERNSNASLSRYFNKEVAEYIIDKKEELKGVKKKVTVIFCDFRNFTNLIDTIQSQEVVELLNKHLSAMVNIIFKNNGTLDKYTGDGFMAVFGAPISKSDDTFRACKTAVEIKEYIDSQKKEGLEDPKRNLSIRIGIATGKGIVGNIGSPNRLEYTVIGKVVNLASRLEQANKKLKTTILIDSTTYEQCSKNIKARNFGKIQIRGIQELIQIYELSSINEQNKQKNYGV